MAQSIRIHLDRYWPLPTWTQARANGLSIEHAVAIAAVRSCLPSLAYEPFQEQGLRALYEALALHVYPARTYAGFGQRLQTLSQSLQGGPLASDVLSRAQQSARLIRQALNGGTYEVNGRTHEYKPDTLAVIALEPQRFLKTVSERTAKQSEEAIWASLAAAQRARQPVGARAQTLRRGPRWRPDERAISDDALREALGLRGVRFGQSVPEKERAALRSALFDAGHDLAHVLGVAPNTLGLGRRLALAIGMRSPYRTHAPGHYLPGRYTIHANRVGGVGFLAHEFAHALDDALGEPLGGRGALLTKVAFRRVHPRTENPSLVAMARLMETLCQDRSLPEADQASRFLRDAALHDARHGRSGRRRYMSTPHELFARAFEMHIDALLSEAGWRSPLLTHNLAVKARNANALAYPGEPERSRVSEAVSQALPTLLAGAGLKIAPQGAKTPEAVASPASEPAPEPQQLGLRL